MFAMGPVFFGSAATGGGYATLAITGAFPAGTVGTAYSSSIPIIGGLEPYSLTGSTGIASGSLDTGFSLSITGVTGARFLTLTCTSPATADTMSFTASIGSTDSQTATSAQSVVVASNASDPYWSSVVSLLYGNGANHGSSFPDETGATWTKSGTIETSTTVAKFGGSSINFISGGLSRAASSDFGFGAGDWTVEGFNYYTSSGIFPCLFDCRSGSGQGFAIYAADGSGGGYLLYADNSAVAATSSSAFSLNTWQHWAVTKQGTTVRGFIGGVLLFTYADTRTLSSSAPGAWGQNFVGTQNMTSAYANCLRVTKGVARYTSTFTPPSTVFPNS